MPKGTVKRIFEDRGFGFLRPEGGGDDVWFHATKVSGPVGFTQLQVGMAVEYDAQAGPRGPQARWVRASGVPAGASEAARPPAPAPRAGSRPPYRFLNPYNFVRFLPAPDPARLQQAIDGPRGAEVVLLGRCAPPPHDRYVGLTGTITCTLQAVTPLFVSNAEGVLPRGEHRSYEFFKLDGQPAIPASSLRGMVRGLFEAVTNSCLPHLTNRRLSYHLPPGEALKLVPARVEKDQTGAWHLRLLPGATRLNYGRRPDGPQYAAWVPQYLRRMIRSSPNVRSDTSYGRRDNVVLGQRRHGDRCWALLRPYRQPRRNFEFLSVEVLADRREALRPDGGALVAEGYLCINNQNIENKHDERFFFSAGGLDHAPIILLPEDVRTGYNALIDDYQERHATAVARRSRPEEREDGKPAFSRFIVDRGAAQLHDGDLVYAQLTGPSDVRYIVPVSVPRVTFERSVDELLPDSHLARCETHGDLCPACRAFGWVRDIGPDEAVPPGESVAYAGRVVFAHATLQTSAGTLPPVPLAILSSPKPTTVRFYLMPGSGSVRSPWTGPDVEAGYDGRTNVLRGRKFYRHHGRAREDEYYRSGGICDDQNRTVRDALLPGATFQFTVQFHNLARVELGALLWSLEMDRTGVHRLGFAKPLGFGSVTVRVDNVRLMHLATRYDRLDADGWEHVEDWATRFVDPFKQALALRHGTAEFERLDHVRDLRILLNEPPSGLPVHYPRTGQQPDPEGRNFEWFMGNNRKRGAALALPTEDQGLPLLTRDGGERP